ncbi:M61 family metallopeptidase [Isoalcanivorax beigongshangi]|uniref:M61 family metallopeptidase n=1 Tax=Isoalcanivorax beigongshangi TaxID=3238810 RepID=A0ABV4AH07_9GAMM
MIDYRIRPLRPEAHLFEVTLTLAQPMPEGQHLSLPAWIPGSYMIRDFARHVVAFDAHSNGQPLDWAKVDKHTWALVPCTGPLTVRIEVYAWDLSVRGAHLDTTHGYFNGPCMFLAPHGLEDQPCRITIEAPAGEQYADWRLATGLRRISGAEDGFGSFEADNYDALLDHPVEMGRFDEARFDACGVPHRVVLSGRHHADLPRLCDDLKRICEYQIRLFGEPAPMDDYLFMTLVTGDGYGGLEHRNSTSLMCSRNDLPRASDGTRVRDAYRSYLGLCSHEYFHTWNVKRIKPEAFTPYNLREENYTEQLWAFEGITSYYDDLTLVRTGLISVDSYLELVGQTLSRVERGSGQRRQSVAESSFDAWTKFYKADENASNAVVSYYAKGALVALALDLTLRQRSGGERSLDDVMRLLWQRHGQTGIGVPEQGIQALVAEVAGETLDDFFQPALYGTDSLPLETLLSQCGVQVEWRAPAGHGDLGGKPAAAAAVSLGVRVADEVQGARIAVAFDQGAAMAAGLSAGDVLVALDGLRVDARRLDDMLSVYQPGDRVQVHAFRRDELMCFEVLLQPGEASLAVLSVSPAGLTEAGQRWLHQ